MDGAGWHASGALLAPDTLALPTLSPNLPELNPAKTNWQFLRQNKLAHRLYDTYEAIVEARCEAWKSFATAPDLIQSITARQWANVS